MLIRTYYVLTTEVLLVGYLAWSNQSPVVITEVDMAGIGSQEYYDNSPIRTSRVRMLTVIGDYKLSLIAL